MGLNNGIWDYTEADTVAPTFSELLNLLGDSVRARFAELLTDSGWVTVGYAAAPGSTVTSFRCRRVGNVVSLLVQATIASLAIPTSGDVANTVILGAVPPGFAPTQIQSLGPGYTGRVAAGSINADGSISLAAISPDATQTGSATLTNLSVSLGGTYLLG